MQIVFQLCPVRDNSARTGILRTLASFGYRFLSFWHLVSGGPQSEQRKGTSAQAQRAAIRRDLKSPGNKQLCIFQVHKTFVALVGRSVLTGFLRSQHKPMPLSL
jgi:hypothetical protein